MCCELLLASQQVRGVTAKDASFHLELEPKPLAAGVARRFVVNHAGDMAAEGALALLTSELVTNGMLHAGTRLMVGIVTGADYVLVAVRDESNAGALLIPPPDVGRPSGRGLLLVDALASQWGVFRHDGGKTVWFTLARTALAAPWLRRR